MIAEGRVDKLAALLAESYRDEPTLTKVGDFVDPYVIISAVAKLRTVVFAGFFSDSSHTGPTGPEAAFSVANTLRAIWNELIPQVAVALRSPGGGTRVGGGGIPLTQLEAESLACDIGDEFLARLPQIRAVLASDVAATFDGDPAAHSTDEVVLSYPGILAIMVYRLAHELYLLDVPLIPRVMSEYAHSLTGIDIHPGASIGRHFMIDHGTGIVIGETAVIGDRVKIYQGVTIGALSTTGGRALHNVKRHPTIESAVTIYSGASILGADTVIGHGATIGSNAFITRSVPARTRVSAKDPKLQWRADEPPVDFAQRDFWYYSI
ncbi:MAG: serine O-acetyltransferase [Propionibacteriaceae bacterium]|jgi:serine O-acetyltransferase|nr:serine O-acetyltransferase [Propionibacteriaceae bacterium]